MFVTSSIDNLFYDEYIEPKKVKNAEGKEIVAYYLNQRASLTMTYMIQDVMTTAIVGSDRLSDTYPVQQASVFAQWDPTYNSTLIATSDIDGKNFTMHKNGEYYSADVIFSKMIQSFEEQLYASVSPSQKLYFLSLKNDSAKSEEMKLANTFVKNGQYKEALAIYDKLYENTHLFEAGYNRIIITFATGEREKAADMAHKLWEDTLSADAMRLYEKLNRKIYALF